jgi:hypothetical protein
MDTPYFPQWRACCAPLGAHTARARGAAESPGGLAVLFGGFFAGLLVPARAGGGSRQRLFGRVDIFWAFLGQVFMRGGSCRWALTRLQAEAITRGRRRPDDSTSAYCQARASLSVAWLELLFASLHRWFTPRVRGQWWGRTVRVIDGTGFSMPDTPKNARRWDRPGGTKPGCGFPTGKLVGLFCLHSGRLLAFVQATCKTHDLKLARRLVCWLQRNEVLIADRAYCGWVFLALLRQRGADFVIRLHQSRRVRSTRHGSSGERWRRPQRESRSARWFWRALPRELPVRLVRFRVRSRGFRTRHVMVVTSLLDRKKFPDRAIAELYGQRWQVELHFRQIKTSLSLDVLRGLSPEVIERELWMHAIAYNLVRALLLESALTHDVPIERLSFKGGIDALMAWTALALRPRAAHRQARRQLLARLAGDQVPRRPERHEPRVKKRRPKNYQLMTRPRSQMRVSKTRKLR